MRNLWVLIGIAVIATSLFLLLTMPPESYLNACLIGMLAGNHLGFIYEKIKQS